MMLGIGMRLSEKGAEDSTQARIWKGDDTGAARRSPPGIQSPQEGRGETRRRPRGGACLSIAGPLILGRMLNVIWLAMLLVAVLVGGFSGRLDVMTEGAFATAKSAVMDIALPLVGLMAIWLGMMRLAERAGLVQSLARGLRPVMRRLFPEVPQDHPAIGAMVLNMAANMLGLGNAATPLGLRAMALLQKLNPHPGVASNSMVTFLAVNTASLQLIPTTAISILAIQGAKNPSIIVVPAILATAVAMVCGIVVARSLSRLRIFRIADGSGDPTGPVTDGNDGEAAPEIVSPSPMGVAGRVMLCAFLFAFAAISFVLIWPAAANALPEALGWHWRYGETWPGLGIAQRILRAISLLAVPFLIGFFPLVAWLRGVNVYEQFCEGAKEAFDTAKRIIPFLVAMLVAIRLLRDAGVVQMATDALRPALNALGFPSDLLPLALMRPLSGSASQGIFVDLVKTHGADSMISRMAATIYGSTETTFYVLAVYFGSVGIRRTRHAVVAGLTADVVAIACAVAVCGYLAR
jgi:spore maturation protein SpmA